MLKNNRESYYTSTWMDEFTLQIKKNLDKSTISEAFHQLADDIQDDELLNYLMTNSSFLLPRITFREHGKGIDILLRFRRKK